MSQLWIVPRLELCSVGLKELISLHDYFRALEWSISHLEALQQTEAVQDMEERLIHHREVCKHSVPLGVALVRY